MVTEGPWGQLKGCWRILLRKCKRKKTEKKALKLHTLAYVCLHNLSINLNDSVPNNWRLLKCEFYFCELRKKENFPSIFQKNRVNMLKRSTVN